MLPACRPPTGCFVMNYEASSSAGVMLCRFFYEPKNKDRVIETIDAVRKGVYRANPRLPRRMSERSVSMPTM